MKYRDVVWNRDFGWASTVTRSKIFKVETLNRLWEDNRASGENGALMRRCYPSKSTISSAVTRTIFRIALITWTMCRNVLFCQFICPHCCRDDSIQFSDPLRIFDSIYPIFLAVYGHFGNIFAFMICVRMQIQKIKYIKSPASMVNFLDSLSFDHRAADWHFNWKLNRWSCFAPIGNRRSRMPNHRPSDLKCTFFRSRLTPLGPCPPMARTREICHWHWKRYGQRFSWVKREERRKMGAVWSKQSRDWSKE
jgi:hypothetical protein